MLGLGEIQLSGPLDGQFRVHAASGFINVADICKSRNKTFSDWKRNDKSQQAITEIAERLGTAEEDLIVSRSTGPYERRGTWCHPQIAALIAAWVDPMFVVWLVQYVSAKAVTPSVDWTKQLEYNERIVGLLERLGGLDDRDRLYYRDCVRSIGMKLNSNIPMVQPSVRCEPLSYQQEEEQPKCMLAELLLYIAETLGPDVKSFKGVLKQRIAAHVKADKAANRWADGTVPVTVENIAFLLRVQSFRCLICDHVLRLTRLLPCDPHQMSIGRIWNHLPHTLENVCLICKKHNTADNEERAVRDMMMECGIESAVWHAMKGQPLMQNPVLACLAGDMVPDVEEDLKCVESWIHTNEEDWLQHSHGLTSQHLSDLGIDTKAKVLTFLDSTRTGLAASKKQKLQHNS
jgi:hypothetical protein